MTGHPAGTVVTEIGLLRTATRIGIVDPHRRAFTLVDFVATVVADEHRLASHDSSSFFDRGSDETNRDPNAILRSFTSPTYSPRTQQADKCLFLGIQTRLARPDDAQMARPEIIDRSPVQILLDDGGTDVENAGNSRRVAEPLQPVTEEPRAACLQELTHRPGELRVYGSRPHPNAVLGLKAKSDSTASDPDVALAECL
jgi:hypothetical protein